ncbi:DUF3632 domain-containing protein [Aspergillus fischeri NRRL 181]|uniref:Uncharacterized protein n=1 Tax=Neosartorya fischeri (strain ATCC 1020 / DSM 3700 / CBS 544.65 / FGSC A1164 / JCM 1740 / NRRL 181 / WB 181) TaxID=331117 RepID=A1CXX8_NEOFI|nr:conserved hypothetical protein [Aspergillus fischeri NRRL 181]EAW25480.1 conserved hypothetical protein [Aspergillus fischeri NRRL 181]KAG2024488.1 hypothetical protein GB937_003680 [Aspergillus fischeri]
MSTPTASWPSLLTTAKHTPRTSTPKPDLPSPQQQSLIDSLRTLPLTNQDADADADQSQAELKSAIADILSEYENENEDEDEDESSTSTSNENETAKEEWENLHAFLAFITKERIVRLEDVGIHILRVALERGEQHHYHRRHPEMKQEGTGAGVGVPPGTGKRKKMAVFVSCAAIWALVMGEELWERRHETEEFPVGLSLSPSQRESVAAGEAAVTVSKSRWQMWIDRFQFLSLAEDLDIKTRELAAEAAAVMRRVT